MIWERIQLHPNYSYDDLVRGMAATHEDGHMQFAPADGSAIPDSTTLNGLVPELNLTIPPLAAIFLVPEG